MKRNSYKFKLICVILFCLLASSLAAEDHGLRLGVYVYDYYFRKVAKETGEDLAAFVDRHFGILQSHHVNAIHLTVNQQDGKEFHEIWLPKMKKYGIQAYLQLDFAYFRIEQEDWEKKEDAAAALAAEFIRNYKNEPAILAFSIREEVAHKHVNSMARYYQKILSLTPDFKIFTLNNNLGAAKDQPVPDPVVYGTDRYSFWWEFSGNGYLASPTFALNWLRTEARRYYPEAARRGADFLWVVTANAYIMGRIVPEPGWSSMNDEKLLKRIERYTQEKRFGWNLDEVKGKQFNWCWKYYRPPVNCTRAMIWTGVMEGARTVLFWSYTPSDGPLATVPQLIERRLGEKPLPERFSVSFITMAGVEGINNQPFEELAATAEELKPYAKLIGIMSKVQESPVETPTKNGIHNGAFMIPGYQGRVVVLHSANVGTWPEGSRNWFPEKANIRIDQYGELVGYQPATGLQQAEFTLNGEGTVFDYATGKEIPLTDGKGHVELLPGGGTMLFIGTRQEFEKLKNSVSK